MTCISRLHDRLLCKALIPDTVSEHASTAESNLRVVIPSNSRPNIPASLIETAGREQFRQCASASHMCCTMVNERSQQISPFEQQIQHVGIVLHKANSWLVPSIVKSDKEAKDLCCILFGFKFQQPQL